mgnify:CR=1 FL=1
MPENGQRESFLKKYKLYKKMLLLANCARVYNIEML